MYVSLSFSPSLPLSQSKQIKSLKKQFECSVSFESTHRRQQNVAEDRGLEGGGEG